MDKLADKLCYRSNSMLNGSPNYNLAPLTKAMALLRLDKVKITESHKMERH